MELTKPVEKRDFHGALTHHNLNVDDCESNEIETTDPKAEEILSLTETLTIMGRVTGREREYRFGDGSSWGAEFQRVLTNGASN